MGDMSGWSALWGLSAAPYLVVMTHSAYSPCCLLLLHGIETCCKIAKRVNSLCSVPFIINWKVVIKYQHMFWQLYNHSHRSGQSWNQGTYSVKVPWEWTSLSCFSWLLLVYVQSLFPKQLSSYISEPVNKRTQGNLNTTRLLVIVFKDEPSNLFRNKLLGAFSVLNDLWYRQ